MNTFCRVYCSTAFSGESTWMETWQYAPVSPPEMTAPVAEVNRRGFLAGSSEPGGKKSWGAVQTAIAPESTTKGVSRLHVPFMGRNLGGASRLHFLYRIVAWRQSSLEELAGSSLAFLTTLSKDRRCTRFSTTLVMCTVGGRGPEGAGGGE